MKASDLRIGNLLLKDGVVVTIDGKSIFDIWCADFLNEPHAYFPMFLTEEWLVKLGWVWNKECKSFEKYPNGDARMNITRTESGGYTMFNYVLNARITDRIFYVHELQNLYHALTGEELKENRS